MPFHGLKESAAASCLIYQVMTGVHYIDFSLGREEMLRQIAQAPPVPLAQRGLVHFRRADEVLRRALAKQPEARFASVAQFADRYAEAAADDVEQWKRERPASTGDSPAKRLQHSTALIALERDLVQLLEPDGNLYKSALPAPTASVNYGAAGIAYALHRIAGVRGDTRMLALADLWLAKAITSCRDDSAFINPSLDITVEVVGKVSLYHTPSGIHCVNAMISHAMGDVMTRAQMIAAFVNACSAPCENLDLTLGRSSTMIGASLLYRLLNEDDVGERELLRGYAGATLDGVWRRLDALPPIRECAEVQFLGIAHGWAGFMYAALLWSSVTGQRVPEGVEARLVQLSEHAEPVGRGVRWKWTTKPVAPDGGRAPTYMPGWCNGSAGMVFLWTLAHRTYGEGKFLELAEKSAYHAWEAASGAVTLCCGCAGQAYALLNLHRSTGEGIWLRRARQLAISACSIPDHPDAPPHSLYKGKLGLAVLAAELEEPSFAHMPLFEIGL